MDGRTTGLRIESPRRSGQYAHSLNVRRLPENGISTVVWQYLLLTIIRNPEPVGDKPSPFARKGFCLFVVRWRQRALLPPGVRWPQGQ